MDRHDFFAPVRYEPQRKPPRNFKPLIIFLVIVVAVVGAGALGYLGLAHIRGAAERQAAADEQLLAVEIPPAAVQIGKPLAWRELSRYDWEIGYEHPRPTVVLGEFDKDGNVEVLQVDYAGPKQVIGMDGKARDVPKAYFPALASYQAWDLERDGVCELVPDTLFFTYQPKVKSWVRIKGTG